MCALAGIGRCTRIELTDSIAGTILMAQFSPHFQTDALQESKVCLIPQTENGFKNTDLYGVYLPLHQNSAGGGVLHFQLKELITSALEAVFTPQSTCFKHQLPPATCYPFATNSILSVPQVRFLRLQPHLPSFCKACHHISAFCTRPSLPQLLLNRVLQLSRVSPYQRTSKSQP